MVEFIKFLVDSVVKNPQDVKVSEEKSDSSIIYNIQVNNKDMGILIGKGGRTIKSLRLLAKAKAIKNNLWVDIKIAE